MSTTFDAAVNLMRFSLRGWRGALVRRQTPPPARPLKLYDIETSPFCRLVREVLTELDLDALILPCPRGGRRFRPEAQRVGGKQQFPLLVDENTGDVLYESADIIDHLLRHYGGHGAAPRGFARRLSVASSAAASLLSLRPQGFAGVRARPSKAPEQPLELYSFESSPYAKPVRDRLCELELPYWLRNTGKGHWRDIGPPLFRDRLFKGALGTTRNRRALAEMTGRVQVPYLVDPNTGVAMYESQAILDYLDRQYAA